MINWIQVEKWLETTGRTEEEYFYMLEAIAEEKAREKINQTKEKEEEK